MERLDIRERWLDQSCLKFHTFYFLISFFPVEFFKWVQLALMDFLPHLGSSAVERAGLVNANASYHTSLFSWSL